MTVKDVIVGILGLLFFGLMIFALGEASAQNQQDIQKQDQETKTFINKCIAQGKRVDTEGSWPSNYLVCNPK